MLRARTACATATIALAVTLLFVHFESQTNTARGQAKQGGATGKPKFASKRITGKTPGHAVEIDVDVTDAKQLHLVVTDAGDGFSCDWADWAEPRLIGPDGDKKLTELKWKTADSSWGQVRFNRNAGGGTLSIAGKPVEYGIGTHAHSVITFDLPKGYTRFQARAGLDNGGTNQNAGNTTSVQFLVYVDKLPAQVRQPQRRGPGGGLDPKQALAALDVGEGLEATIFAAEPDLLSPSNIDVDVRGRVWVCEVVNYRRRNGQRKEGDRILILEDTDGDGKADKTKVFHQGRDIDSAHGICVLGSPDGKSQKVIVSVGSGVYVFHDEDGDDKPDKKTTMFTGIGGTQHDHGIHAFIFGPDGKLYFNFGNSGHQIKDADGKPITDKAGNVVTANRKPYQEGMAFRCNLDGSELETLGWNFRNNWEVTVDSFGTLWQSDNDDDGNRGVRINFVMEFGNYGYKDEFTGAGWKSPRTGMASEIPLQHWHLNDPGVVPNLLQTGAGSPTGICVYEGKLLPKRFHNQVIHCDAGPNVVRAYPVTKDGAGYKATIDNVLVGTRDKWFRPSDVCVAPDGSLLIADWYDPGVGGHGMGDVDRGRIFRIAPPKTKYVMPKHDFSTTEGAIKALQSPTLSVRYVAWQALREGGEKSAPALKALYESKTNPHLRARALWLLGKIEGKKWVDAALMDKDADIRIVGLRLARQLNLYLPTYVKKMVNDPSPQVRRECAIALRRHGPQIPPQLWADLAAQHEGKDRWYLEALGIAAYMRWDACLEAWLEKVGGKWDTAAGRDLIWRSRANKTPEYLARIIVDPSTDVKELPRYFRALDFQDAKAVTEVALKLAFDKSAGSQERKNLIRTEALARLKGIDVAKDPKLRDAVNRALDEAKGTDQFVKLVDKFNVRDRFPDLVELAIKHPTEQLGVDAMVVLLNRRQDDLIRKSLNAKDGKAALATAQAIGTAQHDRATELLLPLITDTKSDSELRRASVRAIGRTRPGAQQLVKLAASKQLDDGLKEAAASVLHQVNFRNLKPRIAKLFPLPASKSKEPLPSLAELVKLRGNVQRGAMLFKTTATCANCHVVNKMGKEVGPDLSEIGGKLSRQALYDSILFPSAAISHNYESYVVETKKGQVATGILVSQTPKEVVLKDKEAILRTFKRSSIEKLRKQPTSLMPTDLLKVMSKQDLVDVVTYVETLRKKQPRD